MEFMLLFAKAPDGSHPPAVTTTFLDLEQTWLSAKELGSAGMVADQAPDNNLRVCLTTLRSGYFFF